MEMEILFPGGESLESRLKGTSIVFGPEVSKDSPLSGIEPLDLFFVSIGLCAGKYVMGFCRSRKIPYDDARVLLSTRWNEDKKMHTHVRIEIELPPGFPEKYKKAVLKAVNLCSVKKHILTPPAFEVTADIKTS
ncbi:MAG: OsmC family protein [Deltaproteobacteria bacterium]|nr:OsmC family protein [Deltaproteobacteria bacterium]MBW2138913.1 OsmC family protein [Deltaproteobacteria bacterium]